MSTAADDLADVVIVGGGHAGLLIGAALAASGFSVAVLDPDTPERVLAAPFDGRALALMYGSKRVLDRLGVWPRVRPIAEPVERVLVEDVAAGTRVTYEAREVANHPFGYGIENRTLRQALLQVVLERGDIRLVAPGRLESLERRADGILARLEDGRAIVARLVIGADGRGSLVRRLAGIGVDRTDYGQKALTFAIRHTDPHRGRVHERLLSGGPLALLPLRGRMCSVTWIEPAAEADRLLALPPAGLLEVLAARIEGELGALELAGTPAAWPLGALHAHRYVAPRIALVGDAAHGVHPIHAQGFNMGVADIAALADALAEAKRRGLDPGSGEALVPYERRRRLDNTLLLGLTDGLNRLFSAELGMLAPVRGLGLAAVDAIPPLKRLAMRRGMGLGG